VTPKTESALFRASPPSLDAETRGDVVALAEVIKCRPEELVRAVGRQLRRVDGHELPRHAHCDVFALEAVSNVLSLTGYQPRDVPIPPDSGLAIARHLLHVKTCKDCQSALRQLECLQPPDLSHLGRPAVT
jgi:hypothetical protein